MTEEDEVRKSGSGVAAIVALVFFALAIAVIGLVVADVYERSAITSVQNMPLKPVLPGPRVWIDERDDGRV